MKFVNYKKPSMYNNSESIDTSKLGEAQNLKDKEIFEFLETINSIYFASLSVLG